MREIEVANLITHRSKAFAIARLLQSLQFLKQHVQPGKVYHFKSVQANVQSNAYRRVLYEVPNSQNFVSEEMLNQIKKASMKA